MDTITQGVLGATVAEAGWRKEVGPKALTVGMLCGLLPDLDVFSGLFGAWAGIEHHRGATHSLLFAIVMAPFLGWLGWRWANRNGRLISWMHLCFWCVVTHPMLDICTTYGTQFLWPFSNKRLTIDAIAVFDPVYTILLIASLVIARRYNKVNPYVGRIAACIALVLGSGYIGFGYTRSQNASAIARKQLVAGGFQPVRLRATPTLGNLRVWRIMALDKEDNLRVGIFVYKSGEKIRFYKIKRPKSPLVTRALAHPRIKMFTWFADGFLSIKLVKTKAGGTTVVMHDQRFGSMRKASRAFWGASVHFGPKGKLLYARRIQHNPLAMNMPKEFAYLWTQIWR